MTVAAEPVLIRSTIPARPDRGRNQPHLPGRGICHGCLIMVLGRVVELAFFGIKAEGQSLETVTKPLTAVSD